MGKIIRMIPPDLLKSGLSEMFDIKRTTEDTELKQFLGKQVRYKRELLTSEFIQRNGTICLETVFTVEQVQLTYDSRRCLRIYAPGDRFGRPAFPNELEILN